MAADVMTGNDENCMAWIQANRKEEATEEGGGERRRRRERRRSRS
jgi:hypothetical protein